MKIKTIIDNVENTIEFNGSTINDLLKELNLIEENWIITRNNNVLYIDEEINEGDSIEFHKVWSGG